MTVDGLKARGPKSCWAKREHTYIRVRVNITTPS